MAAIILASGNQGKLKEFQSILGVLDLEIVSMKQLGKLPEVIEDGSSFKENAVKKASTIFNFSKKPTIADDSGLEVDFLKGRPGVFSARFAGENASDKENNTKLLNELKGVPLQHRTARFVCVVALVWKDGSLYTAKGSCEGYIGFEPKGDNGFGYDPLFVVPQYNKTFAQLPPHVKNSISHRAKALKEMKQILSNLLQIQSKRER